MRENMQSHKVFLVDDHPLFRRGLASLVNGHRRFHISGQAESVSEAMQMMQNDPPHVAVVDLSLKHSNGLELISALKQALPETAVLVLSMHDERHYAERCIRAGALGYVMKTESPDVILAALDLAARGEIVLSDQMRALAVERFIKGMSGVGPAPESILSNRELEVFRLLGMGKETREIAQNLGLSIKTVQTFCSKIRDKLHIDSGSALVREAVRWTESASGA